MNILLISCLISGGFGAFSLILSWFAPRTKRVDSSDFFYYALIYFVICGIFFAQIKIDKEFNLINEQIQQLKEGEQ